jgi:hypothetical protein
MAVTHLSGDDKIFWFNGTFPVEITGDLSGEALVVGTLRIHGSTAEYSTRHQPIFIHACDDNGPPNGPGGIAWTEMSLTRQ